MYFKLITLIFIGWSLSAQAQSKVFDSVPNRNCGTDEKLLEFEMTDPEGYESFINFRTKALAKATEAALVKSASCCPGGILQIPIAFHIVHDGSPVGSGTNFSLAQIQEVVDVLNQDFGGYNADKDIMPPATDPSNFQQIDAQNTCIQFCIGLIDRAPHPGGSPDLSTVIPTSGRNNYLNLWVGTNISGPGVLGYAYLPGGAPASVDGVYINEDYFAPSVSLAPFDLGRTTTHEVGHYLGLNHTFDGCGAGDGIADTPPQTNSSSGCPTHPYTGGGCGATVASPTLFYNYMDYSNDACLVMFTQGQSTLMNSPAGALHPTRVTSGACDQALMATTCPTVAPAPINENLDFCNTGGEINLLDYQAAAYFSPSSTACYLWSSSGASGSSTAYAAKTIVPVHSGTTCEPETVVYSLAIDCPVSGTSVAASAGTITVNVYPDPATLTNYFTIADGDCDGPTVTFSPTDCSTYISVVQNGGPTFPTTPASSGTVNYDVMYNLAPSCCTTSGGNPGANLVADPSFEGGSPNATWTESSTAFGTPLCSVATCGAATQTNTGDWAIWAGGTAGGDDGFVEQSVTFPSTNATLEFYLSCSAGAAGNTFTITVDGTTVYAITAADNPPCTGTYNLVSINLDAYADGAPHTIQLAYVTVDNQSFYIDDVSLFEVIGASNPCIATATANYNCAVSTSCEASVGSFGQ